MTSQTIHGHKLKLLLYAGVSWLSQQVDAINRMNVFPVPDGDTGINMYHTLKRAYEEIEPLNTANISLVARRFAHGALMGARGNSGTILSQLLQGFAEGLDDAETMAPQQMLKACENGVKLAYQSVQDPVEGTILTVAREALESLQQTDHSDMLLEDIFDILVSTAEQALYNTPNLLPVLKEAGVVDSGGMGLFFFLQGMARYKDGEPLADFAPPTRLPSDSASWGKAPTSDDKKGYGYDVQFLMLGDKLDINAIRQDLENIGWSVLVVGDESTLKVHIHVHNPADPFNYAIGLGAELDDIVVENMHRQYKEYIRTHQQSQKTEVNIPTHGIAVVSVASGEGLTAIFNDLNCTQVIAGGQTMNPSAEDFLTAIEQLATDKIILLPNNSNIILTAKQVAQLATEKEVRVIPTKTIMQGISAMIAYSGYDYNAVTFDEMAANMTEASEFVLSIEITRSTRSTELAGMTIAEGHYLGIVEGQIRVVDQSLDSTVLAALDEIKSDDYELATLYYGQEISRDSVNSLIERLSNAIKGLEFEAVYGGQPLYPYLISVE